MLSSYPKTEAQMMRALSNTSSLDILYSLIYLITYLDSRIEKDHFISIVLQRFMNDKNMY